MFSLLVSTNIWILFKSSLYSNLTSSSNSSLPFSILKSTTSFIKTSASDLDTCYILYVVTRDIKSTEIKIQLKIYQNAFEVFSFAKILYSSKLKMAFFTLLKKFIFVSSMFYTNSLLKLLSTCIIFTFKYT